MKHLFCMLIGVTFLYVVAIPAANGQIAVGGTFTLQKSVTAGGGTEKQTSPVGENGTTGQAVAGHHSTGGQFSVRSGFWTPDELSPTAAGVTLSGRVMTADGRGITNVRVTLTSSTGETRTLVTSTFGYFKFADVAAGDTYVISVTAKRFTFPEATKLVQVTDNIADCNFVANPL